MIEMKENYHEEIKFHKENLKHFTKLQSLIDSKKSKIDAIKSMDCEDNFTRVYACDLLTKSTTQNQRIDIARNMIRVKGNPFLAYTKRGEALSMAKMSINRILLETLK